MAIERILLQVSDVARSVDFYVRFLHMPVIGQQTKDHALLDAVTATIELVRVEHPIGSTWVPDDLQRGFRHLGFAVEKLDELVAELRTGNVPFHLDPLDAEGEVRITFFFDPDGTLLELVEGDLEYHSIVDAAGVAAGRALGTPARPRFDHIALTVDDFMATKERYASVDFAHLGTINQPNDPRGFIIEYLKSGDTVLEVFEFEADKISRDPQVESVGFVAVRLTDDDVTEHSSLVGTIADGRQVRRDPDGFTVITTVAP